LGAWSKIIHYCVSDAGRRLSLLKVDTTSAFQHLTSKPKEIEYCDEYQSSVLRAGNLTAEPEVNYSPKGTAVVSGSLANNESYGCAGSALGALATLRASLQVSIMGIMTAITTTTIVTTTKANPTGTTTAPTASRSMGIFEQMPVSELAVMVEGCRQLQSAGRA
jgi:hypothetical protein